MNARSRVAALGGALVTVLVLSACGGGDTSNTGSGGGAPAPAVEAAEISPEHNEADVRFAREMIPHHEQAIEMTDLAAERAESEDVKALAEQISAAQQPEIETMRAMLEAWGQAMSEGPDGMDMGGMQGMMSPQQMTELANASGAMFDRMFLEMMITHHEGAVEMARAEQVDGQNRQAVELAKQIEATQVREIQDMQDLLAGL